MEENKVKNNEDNFKDANEVEDTVSEEMVTKIKKTPKKRRRAKKCPRCRTSMRKAGEIKAGPRGGLRPVYYCPRCGCRIVG